MMRHLGDSSWCRVLRMLLDGIIKEETPRESLALWKTKHLDSDLRDLLGGLTKFDPAKRITADEALA